MTRSEEELMPAITLHPSVHCAPLLLGALLLASGPAPARGEEEPQAIFLSLGDYHFTPDTLEVHAGRPVVLTLTNTDTLTPHNFTLQDAKAGLDIDTNVSAGSKAVIEFTPAIPGDYIFFCNKKLPFMKSHRDRGMEGSLHVTGPATP
jgi:plastocyanin